MFPIFVYYKCKRTGRGVVIYLVAFVVTYFAMIDIRYVFSVPNNHVVENLIIVNVILFGMYALMTRDSIRVVRANVLV